MYSLTFHRCCTFPRWDLAEVRYRTRTFLPLMGNSSIFSCEVAVIYRIQRASRGLGKVTPLLSKNGTASNFRMRLTPPGMIVKKEVLVRLALLWHLSTLFLPCWICSNCRLCR